LARTEDRVLIAVLLTVCFLYCMTPVYSENLFWHMRNGEDILDSGRIRTVDDLTWTMRGRTWIQQEWLAEVAFAASWRIAGPSGLIALKSIVVLGGVALAAAAAMRRGARGSAVALTAVLWFSVTQARWFERPHIFTDLFFPLYLFLLAGRPRPFWKDLALFVPLQVLWVNTHAGFVMGPFLLALPALDALVRRDARRFAHSAGLAAAALAACGIHPNGYASLTYLPGFLSQPLFRDSIREWWSPFDPRYGTVRTAATLLVLGGASIAILALGRKRAAWSLSGLVMIAVLFASSLFAARNIELLALASVVVVSPLLGRIPWPAPALLLAAAAAIPPLYGVPREFGPPRRFGPGMAWEIYPVGLADFLESHGLHGRVFNTNEISGYLEYRFGEDLPLYMDGRCLLYPQSFYAEYLLLAQSPDSSDAALQMEVVGARGFDLALFDWPSRAGSVAFLLAELPGWTPVYWDSLTIAYASRRWLDSTGNDSLAFDLVDPLAPEELLERPIDDIPARLLPEMERASGMAADADLPAVVGCCLALRADDSAEAGRFRASISSAELREAVGMAMGADSSGQAASPQVRTILVWALVHDGRWEEAVEQATRSGDQQLADAVRILAPPSAGDLGIPGPPPGVPSEVFPGYLLGSMTHAESTSVRSAALFAAGMGAEASGLAGAVTSSGQAHPWALATAAVVLESCGHDRDAVSAAGRALSAGVTPLTLFAMGRVEALAGRYDSAVVWLRRASRMAPSAPMVRLELAADMWRSGNLQEAAEQYGLAGSLGAALPPSALRRMGWASVLSAGAVDRQAGARQD